MNNKTEAKVIGIKNYIEQFNETEQLLLNFLFDEAQRGLADDEIILTYDFLMDLLEINDKDELNLLLDNLWEKEVRPILIIEGAARQKFVFFLSFVKNLDESSLHVCLNPRLAL